MQSLRTVRAVLGDGQLPNEWGNVPETHMASLSIAEINFADLHCTWDPFNPGASLPESCSPHASLADIGYHLAQKYTSDGRARAVRCGEWT